VRVAMRSGGGLGKKMLTEPTALIVAIGATS
jgi:hypothetical protein